MIGEFIAANMRHLCTAVRLWLALVLMLLAACCLTLPPHASLLDLLREYAATSGGIFPVSVLSWKTLFFAVLLGLAFVPHALGALWNAVLGIAFPLSLGWLTCMVFDPHLLLPAPLDSCREAVAFMQMPDTGGAMVSLALCACILALLCAATRVRVLVTVLVSLALWFVLSDMLWWWLAGDVSPDSLLYDVAQPVKFHPDMRAAAGHLLRRVCTGHVHTPSLYEQEAARQGTGSPAGARTASGSGTGYHPR